jgi:hypothetical protein
METILIELVLAGIKGGVAGAGVFLAGMTEANWIALAEGVAAELAPEIAAKLGMVHPSLETLVKDVMDGVGAALASQAARDWFTANGLAAIKHDPGISSES